MCQSMVHISRAYLTIFHLNDLFSNHTQGLACPGPTSWCWQCVHSSTFMSCILSSDGLGCKRHIQSIVSIRHTGNRTNVPALIISLCAGSFRTLLFWFFPFSPSYHPPTAGMTSLHFPCLLHYFPTPQPPEIQLLAPPQLKSSWAEWVHDGSLPLIAQSLRWLLFHHMSGIFKMCFVGGYLHRSQVIKRLGTELLILPSSYKQVPPRWGSLPPLVFLLRASKRKLSCLKDLGLCYLRRYLATPDV